MKCWVGGCGPSSHGLQRPTVVKRDCVSATRAAPDPSLTGGVAWRGVVCQAGRLASQRTSTPELALVGVQGSRCSSTGDRQWQEAGLGTVSPQQGLAAFLDPAPGGAHCICGEHLEDVLGGLIPPPESMASPRDLFSAAALSAVLHAAQGPCLQLSQPTSPQEQLLPISQELV